MACSDPGDDRSEVEVSASHTQGSGTARSSRRWLFAQLALIVAAAAVVAFFTFASPSAVSLVQRFTPQSLGDQPGGAVVLAGEDRKLAVGLAVASRVHGLLAVATVFGASGRGATGLRPTLTITDRDGTRSRAAATTCGAGCYEAAFPTRAIPSHASIRFDDGSHISFTLPRHGPTAQALALVHDAANEYKRLRSMVTHERLASSPTAVVYTTYYAVAPNRLRFRIRGEGESIIIAKRRWDRGLHGGWHESAQSPINPLMPYWTPVVQDATILGSATVQGRPVWVVSFAAPQTPGFFRIWVDKSNHRTLELEMTAAAHFMHHAYDQFNAPIAVVPPKTR
jgi:hypothetical protein